MIKKNVSIAAFEIQSRYYHIGNWLKPVVSGTYDGVSRKLCKNLPRKVGPKGPGSFF